LNTTPKNKDFFLFSTFVFFASLSVWIKVTVVWSYIPVPWQSLSDKKKILSLFYWLRR
jgi:hypothetical protein